MGRLREELEGMDIRGRRIVVWKRLGRRAEVRMGGSCRGVPNAGENTLEYQVIGIEVQA